MNEEQKQKDNSMASIYLDTQSRNWKLKTKVDGKDTRITIRKARDGESNLVKPLDVIAFAERHGKPTAQPTAQPTEQPEQPRDPREPTAESLLSFLDWFHEDCEKTRRPATVIRVRRILRRFKEFVGEHDRTLDSLKYAYFKDFFDWRISQGRIKNHVGVGELSALSGLFTAAVNRELIPNNPMKSVLRELKKAHPSPEETKYLDEGQILLFLKTLDEACEPGRAFSGAYRDQARRDNADAARLLLATGIRVGACVSLRWDWLDEGLTRIVIPQANDKIKRGYTAMISRLGREVLARRRESNATGRVFPENITVDSVYFFLKSLCNIFPHQLRHSFATQLVKNHVLIQVICDLLGQRDLKTTQRYAKVVDEAKQAAVDTLVW